MQAKKGLNLNDVKIKNKLSILKLLATGKSMSRIELANHTGLTKMTLSNLVPELIQEGMVIETTLLSNEYQTGRKPILLTIAPSAPVICGILIRRDVFTIIIADLQGAIIDKICADYPTPLTNHTLQQLITSNYQLITQRNQRKLLGIGISSIGPLDDTKGILLAPPDFGQVSNFKVVDFVREISTLPIFLINDANAAALAENLYGIGKNVPNYIYLHLMNGIGAGLVLNNKVHTGNLGQSGEIGHTSINFSGPQCFCGSFGCLDYYTNITNIKQRISELSHLHPESSLLKIDNISLTSLIDEAHQQDTLAILVLDEFCSFLAYALINILSLIDSSFIIIGYEFTAPGEFIEKSLLNKLTTFPGISNYKDITIMHSSFASNAPLIGSIAVVSDHFFNGRIKIAI